RPALVDQPREAAPEMDSLLLGDLRQARQWFAVIVFQIGNVTEGEYFGVSANLEIGLDDHPTGLVERTPELASERRRTDACGPDDEPDWLPLPGKSELLRADAVDHLLGLDDHPELLQTFLCIIREFL